MSKEKNNGLSVGPFGVRIDAPAQTYFDKYYLDIQEKVVFKRSGHLDENGDELGVEETKFIIKKIDIDELINSQRDTVGVDSYVKALMVQGIDINELNTSVDDNVNDFSQCPDNLADSMLIGDSAREAFSNLDPALKGNHTTIEGFLNSLTQDNVDKYIKGRIEALTGQSEKKEVSE